MKKLLITQESQPGYLMWRLARNVILASIIGGCCLSSAMAADVVGISGITEPIHDVHLSLTTMGTVSQIFYREGDYVKRGTVILNLDLKLEALEVKRRKLILESKAEVNSASARVATMASHLKSTRELYKITRSISKEELELQQLEYDLVVAEKKRIEDNELRELIEFEIAVEQLNNRSLRAPFSGVITELLVDLGEASELDVPLVRLVDTSQGLFICTVEEQVGRTLKSGQTVELEIQAGATAVKIEGRITYVDPIVDPASGLQRVKALFQNKDGKIHPGVAGTMFVAGVDSVATK